jgi:TonB family protein
MRRAPLRGGTRQVAITLFASWAAAAAAQLPTIAADASRKPYYVPGAPVVIASPDYPAAALAAGTTAQVEVAGTVQADGGFVPKRVAGSSGAFEQSVREVLKFWRFIPAMDAGTCGFREHEAAYRVWFEIDAGKPKVSVSMVPRSADAPAWFLAPPQLPRADARRSPEYPRSMIRQNVAYAILVAYVPVRRDGSTGEVTTLPGTHHPDFEAATIAALREWRFDPPAGWPAERQVVCAEIPVEFRLADNPEFPGMSPGIFRPAGPGPRLR